MFAKYEAVARYGNLIAQVAQGLPAEAGFPPFHHAAFSPSWPVCTHSFVVAWFMGYADQSEDQAFDDGSRRIASRKSARYEVVLGRLRAEESDMCNTADYVGSVLACGDPVVAPIDDSVCQTWPAAPYESGATNAQVHAQVAIDAEVLRVELPKQWCSALVACGVHGACSGITLEPTGTEVFVEGRFTGSRSQWLVKI